MYTIHVCEFAEVLKKMPEVRKLNFHDFQKMNDEFVFVGVLGFEERCLAIPEGFAASKIHQAKKSFYLQYSTNSQDNEINKPRLLAALAKLSSETESVVCDVLAFSGDFRAKLNACSVIGKPLQVVFDISGCSSMPLLLALKVLLELDANLHIVYSEAETYHPTKDEWEKARDEHTKEEGFGLAKGVGNILPSSEHPGLRRDNMLELVFAFPTFKPERSKAVIAHIDPSLATNPGDRVIWFIGKPHLGENEWRMEAVKEINKISDDVPHYFVSTFDYRETLFNLNKTWEEYNEKYHITISPLGSKMQSLGIALFWQIHQEISMIFAIPKEYNAKQYSESYSDTWYIPFGMTKDVVKLLSCIGSLEIGNHEGKD
jgi:hypothetical protein